MKNHLGRTVLLLITLFVLSALTGSCSKETEKRKITFPSTNILTVQTSWGVVTSTYLRLREKPSTDANAVTTLWRGNILEILSKTNKPEKLEGEEDYWYQINYEGLNGWVFGAYLEVFRSRKMAEEAAGEL
jgi:uncharacterized protein YgiM (DUF1202 family)